MRREEGKERGCTHVSHAVVDRPLTNCRRKDGALFLSGDFPWSNALSYVEQCCSRVKAIRYRNPIRQVSCFSPVGTSLCSH